MKYVTKIKKALVLKAKSEPAPPKVKLIAYIMYFRSTLEYIASVWDPYKKNQIDELEKVQRKAVPFVLSKYKQLDSVRDMLNSLNLPLLCVRRKTARLKFFFMFSHHLYNMDPYTSITHGVTRELIYLSSNQYGLHKCIIDAYRFSVFPRTVKYWNNLPQNILSSDCLVEFESALLNMCDLD
uniref:Putative endonuclease/reverse transcript n=1 Tax=Ixodes ricinus TaxID=34613 RepID=A0A0K8R8U8_IXORI